MDERKNNGAESDAGDAGDEAMIEGYLDRLCAPLAGWPAERRDEARAEVRRHLEMLCTRAEEEQEPGAAVQAALRKFGEPSRIGRAMARRARWDNLRRWWRDPSQWKERLVLLGFLVSGAFGAACTVEMCRQFGWGHHFWAHFIIGPLMPLVLGALLGLRSTERWGYALIVAIALLMLTQLPIPGHLSHADLDEAGFGDLSGVVRFAYVVMWLWNACAACGVARILAQAVRGGELGARHA